MLFRSLPDDAPMSTLRKVFAWVDPKNPTQSASKFPHHFVSSGGEVGAASTVACSSGIGILNGAHSGANIPPGDRQGVYSHLAKHLKDAGMTPPDLKSRSEINDDVLERVLAHLDTLAERADPVADTPSSEEPDRVRSDTENAERTENTQDNEESEPAASTHDPSLTVADRMRALSVRYRLPVD